MGKTLTERQRRKKIRSAKRSDAQEALDEYKGLGKQQKKPGKVLTYRQKRVGLDKQHGRD